MLILFLVLWTIDLWILDRWRVPYHSAIQLKSSGECDFLLLLPLPLFIPSNLFSPLLPPCLFFLLIAANFTFILSFTFGSLILYSMDMTLLSNSLGWSIEESIAIFYSLLLIIYFLIPSLPGEEMKLAFNRLLKIVFLPGNTITFPEVLLADALTSLSKVLKDFGTTLVSIYSILSHQNVLEFHDNAMILVALLASLPFWIRVRQCYVQLDSCVDNIAKIPVYLNILKYLSAFPPIWLTAAASLGYTHPMMPVWITIAAVVNTLFSFSVSEYPFLL